MCAFLIFLFVLLTCRIMYTGSSMYLFLLWNLFLGWVPYWLSVKVHMVSIKWLGWFISGCWLLFFPNALYIITDLIHLEDIDGAPVWFDALLILTAATIGIMLAFASLQKIKKFIKNTSNIDLSDMAIIGVLFIGSFGVYLGRFLRWNSWDLITNPFYITRQVALQFYKPVENYKTWVITVLFTCFFSLLYFTIKKLTLLVNKIN